MKQKLLMLLMLLVTSVAGAWADSNVAKIGSTEYATLVEAVKAANQTQDATITLLANCNTDAELIGIEKNMTIDLGTFTLNDNTHNNGRVFKLATENVEFTIKNGTIYNAGTYKYDGYGLVQINAGNITLNLTDVTFTGSYLDNIVYYTGTGSVICDDSESDKNKINLTNVNCTTDFSFYKRRSSDACGEAELNVTGGSYVVTDGDSKCIFGSNGKSTFTNVTITSNACTAIHGGQTTLSGCTITSTNTATGRAQAVDISGGTSKNPSVVDNCTITSTYNYGLATDANAYVKVTNSTIYGGKHAIHVNSSGGTFSIEEGNTISGDEAALFSNTEKYYQPTASIINVVGADTRIKGNIKVSSDNTHIYLAGGIYSVDPATQLVSEEGQSIELADGYMIIDNPDATTKSDYPYKVVKAVAQITTDDTTVKYATLEAAVAAVTTSDKTTITMIGDETFAENTGVTISKTQNIVLDLNGHKIGNNITVAAASATITNCGTLEICDNSTEANGVITNGVTEDATGDWWSEPRKNWVTNTITNTGTLTLTSGTIQNTATGISYCVDNNSNGVVATFNMNGGKLEDVGCAMRMFCNSTTCQNYFNMTGGTIESKNSQPFWVQYPSSGKELATLNISGGTLLGNTYCWYDYSFGKTEKPGDNASYSITGGYFRGAVISYYKTGFISGGYFNAKTYDDEGTTIELSKFVAEGKCVVANTEEATKDAYPWTIGVAKTYVAQIDDTKYETLAEAVAAVTTSNPTTIKMIASPTVEYTGETYVTIESGKNITLDLNGQTITTKINNGTNASQFIMNNGTFTVTDSQEKTDGKFNGKIIHAASPTWVDDGTGTYAGSYQSNLITNKGTLTINGGHLEHASTSGSTGNAAYVINNYEGATTTINDGELVDAWTAVRLWCNSTTSTSVMTINGGSISAARNCILVQSPSSSAKGLGELTINGGTFTAKKANGSSNAYPVQFWEACTSGGSNMAVKVNGGIFSGETGIFEFDYTAGTTETKKSAIVVTGGYYSTTAAERSAFQTNYVATGYKAIANDGLNTSAPVKDYPTMIGQVTQENQQIDVKEGGEGTKTATATIAITATPQAGDETITTEVQQKINATTTVSGVELTTTPSTGETYSGIQTVVNNAKSAGTDDFKTAIEKATNIDVHVDVKVTPSALTATTALNSIKYALQPVATVTFSKDGTNYKSTTTNVTNAMIDQTQDIEVSIYTGFKPIRIRHNADDTEKTLIETFTGDQITYDETTGVATVTIHHFSTLTAEQEEVTGTIYYATTEGNQTVENATLKTFVETTRATYPNAVMVVAAENKDKVSSVENVIVDNGESATPRYTCANFVLTDLCESKYDAMDDDELKNVINFYSPVNFTATAGSYHRSLRSGYNSACVPFALSSIDNASLLKYSYFDATSGHIYFSKATSIAAGEATIILTSAATEWNETFSNTEIVGSPVESTGDTFFGGVFVTTNAYKSTAGATGYYSVNTENGMFAALKNYLFPLRACFKLTMSGQTAREFSIAIIDGSATGIDSIDSESISDNSIYTIDGKRVESANARGMYIINGKKVIK